MTHMEDTCNSPTVCYTKSSKLSEDEELSKLAIKRKEAKLSQQTLADMVGLSRRALQSYELKTRDINKCAVGVAVKLADALGCDVKDLLEPEEKL